MTTDLKITHSVIKSFKGCQNATKYRYVDLLTPKVFRSKPLKRGIWFHEMLEARYKGESVTAVHKHNTRKFSQMFDEEKEALGPNLPEEMAELYKSYAWYYHNDTSWKVIEAEGKLSAKLPNGMPGQGKYDLLIEDEYGLYLVDHKTHERLPTWDYRRLDQQAPYYIWMARQMGIPVRGFIWNYVVPKGPEPLKFTKGSKNVPSRLYKTQPAVTDFPTVDKHLTPGQRDMPEVQQILAQLYLNRYDRDTVQTSPVFRRDLYEPDDATIDRVIDDITATADRYGDFRDSLWHEKTVVERTVGRNCEWCDFRNLCIAELTDQNADIIRRKEFTTHDPFEYYGDPSNDGGAENV